MENLGIIFSSFSRQLLSAFLFSFFCFFDIIAQLTFLYLLFFSSILIFFTCFLNDVSIDYEICQHISSSPYQLWHFLTHQYSRHHHRRFNGQRELLQTCLHWHTSFYTSISIWQNQNNLHNFSKLYVCFQKFHVQRINS